MTHFFFSPHSLLHLTSISSLLSPWPPCNKDTNSPFLLFTLYISFFLTNLHYFPDALTRNVKLAHLFISIQYLHRSPLRYPYWNTTHITTVLFYLGLHVSFLNLRQYSIHTYLIIYGTHYKLVRRSDGISEGEGIGSNHVGIKVSPNCTALLYPLLLLPIPNAR